MAKSMVEKYEQILSADPGSMVFVELAKALLDRGDSKRAIDICSAGLQHHPESVVGRVLWGKALINSGHAAEAMAQFDEAIAIDRENPYAYNLIGEVLLHKGLHRSALPILKKAVALQPTDNRVRQWLEQTTRALNGDKTPIKPDFTQIDPPVETQATAPGRPSLPSLMMGANEATVTDVRALPETPPPAAEVAVAPVTSPGPAERNTENVELVRGMTDIFQSLEARQAAEEKSDSPSEPSAPQSALPPVEEPPAPVEDAPAEPPALVEEASTHPAPEPSGPLPVPAEASAPADDEPSAPHRIEAPPVDGEPSEDEPPAHAALSEDEPPAHAALSIPSARPAEPTVPAPPPPGPSPAYRPELPPGDDEAPATQRAYVGSSTEPEIPATSTLPGVAPPSPSLTTTFPDLTREVPSSRESSETVPLPLSPVIAPAPVSSPPRHSGGPPPLQSRGKMAAAPPGGPPPLVSRPKMAAAPSVLSDLPDLGVPGLTTSMVLPKVELSSQAAEDIAKQYEQELRAKLAAAENKPPSFLSKHGLKIGGAVVAVLAAGVGLSVYRYQKRAHTNVPESLARARTGIDKDTLASYQAALVEVADVEAARPDEALAPALAAYAHAVMYREHGLTSAEREEALKALALADASAKYPDLAAAARYYLADTDTERSAEAKTVLETPGGAEVHELAGRLRLQTDTRRALEQLQESLKAQPNHVRSYLVLGDYYLDKGEAAHAYDMFSQAKGISEHHPAALLGLAEARLALNKELEEARTDVAGLEKDPALNADDHSRLDLVGGRLLTEAGKTDDAQKRLQAGLARDPSRAAAFHQALAEVYSARGEGQHAFDELSSALRERPHDPALIEATARAALTFGRPQDALKLTEGTDDRKLHLVRGLAHYDLGEYDAAKKELLATRRDKGMPSEAAVALARVDIASGHKDEAREALGAIAKAGKLSARASLAQGELALADGDREAAKKAFSAAAEDPHEASASLALGRELFAEGKLTAAQVALAQAVERNQFLAPAQLLLAHTLLDLGAPASAQPHLQTYLKEHRDDPSAQALVARLALLRNDLVEARRAADQAMAHPGKDPSEAQWTHSQIALAAGDGSTALREIEKRAKSGHGAEAWCDLGEALLDLDDARDASVAFGKALRVEKQNLRAQVGQAVAEPSHNKSSRTLEALADPTSHLPPALQARVVAALARAKTGDPARDLARKAVALSEASSAAQLALGVALGGSDDATVAALSKAVALEPASAEAHIALAESLSAKGETQRAAGEAEVARRINPHGPSADRAKRLLAGDSKRRGK